MCQQRFIAYEGQTNFYVTEMELTQYYLVIVDGVLLKEGYFRNHNIVIFLTGLSEGTEIIIMN